MIVTVDPDSPVPAFEQLRSAVRRLITVGTLPVGARLPTVRQLAADLSLAPGTVVRAFRELEAEGLIETRGRHGTRVKATPAVPPSAERRSRLHDAAIAYAAVASELAVSPTAALKAARRALDPSLGPGAT